MSPEAVLTVVTIVLAVLALIPEERGLDLRLRLRGRALTVLIAASAAGIYWALMEPIHALPFVRQIPRVVPWLPGWSAASSSLALLLLVTGYSLLRYSRPLPNYRVGRLRSALETTIARRRFGEAIHLLEVHFGTIKQCIEGKYWQLRVRRRFLPTPSEQYVKALRSPQVVKESPIMGSLEPNADSESTETTFSFNVPHIPKPSWLTRLVSELTDRPKEDAEHIARSLGLSRDLIRHIAANHPYLGISLSRLQSTWILREFAEAFSQSLFTDPDSLLYRELRRAENFDSKGNFAVDSQTQPLLALLCEDADREGGPQLLYTYLYAYSSLLGPSAPRDTLDALNRPLDNFYERGRWSSPFFATVHLYAVVVPRNATNLTAPGLNLYGLRGLAKSLLDALSPHHDVDLTREWPTPIHYVLYEIVSLLVDTVEIWRDRPGDLPANKLAHIVDGKPHILPAHAIDVLSAVMYEILMSEKLDGRFKGYLLDVWWRAYWEKYKSAWSQSGTILDSLARAGRGVESGSAYQAGLADALVHVDMMMQISEGGDRVREAFLLPPFRMS